MLPSNMPLHLAKIVAIMAKRKSRKRVQRKKRLRNRARNAQQGHDRIWQDYFADDAVYGDDIFRRRFRMRRNLFMRIVSDLERSDSFFQQRPDALGRMGLSPIQKCVAAVRQLAYGITADAVDEYTRVAESTALLALKKFCSCVISQYGEEYLRPLHNADDIARVTAVGAERGFPGMLGSLDCMHWVWKNCPTAWHGQYAGKVSKPTIVLEAVVSSRTISGFGMPSSVCPAPITISMCWIDRIFSRDWKMGWRPKSILP